MSNKNSTPQQKAAWEENKNLGTSKAGAISADVYGHYLSAKAKPGTKLYKEFRSSALITDHAKNGTGPTPLPFWTWNRHAQIFSFRVKRRPLRAGISTMFCENNRGSGRCSTRQLKDALVLKALDRANNPAHNFKFLGRGARERLALRGLVG